MEIFSVDLFDWFDSVFDVGNALLPLCSCEIFKPIFMLAHSITVIFRYV